MRKARRRSRPRDAAPLTEAAGELTAQAVRSLYRGDTAAFQRLVADLTGRPGVPGWPLAVHRCLAARLEQGITTAWERGWQPADVVRFASRRRTARHARLATDVIAGEMRAYTSTTVDDQWYEQLAALEAEVWWEDDDEHPDAWCGREEVGHATYVACAIELVHLLETLPRLPNLSPPPGTPTTGTSGTRTSGTGGANTGASGTGTSGTSRAEADSGTGGADTGGSSKGRAGQGGASPGGDSTGAPGASGSDGPGLGPRAASRGRIRDVDQRTLGRVRALLAKAESTEFPEEAEALSARAQELMARHSIDHALLAAETGDMGGPAGRRIAVDNPYDSPKAVLLTVVADANRCRAVWHRELGFSTVVGYPADLAAVEMLFTSLLVQATSAMVHAGPRRDARGRSRTRSFRHAFLNAYAARIGERLREAADRATASAGGNVLVPVLAVRDRAVEQAVGTMFPNLARGRAGSVSNYEGWVAGRAAADLASLNGRLEVTGAHHRS
ncbi:DUF2786 domain-containing protein [Actinomadura sp. 3N407]|uniref:DUF2786 domain-containing protein n=1 Tax=Actinomadura sp. 3N407 TaxID=3457423 RepID=UPI003FCCF845